MPRGACLNDGARRAPLRVVVNFVVGVAALLPTGALKEILLKLVSPGNIDNAP